MSCSNSLNGGGIGGASGLPFSMHVPQKPNINGERSKKIEHHVGVLGKKEIQIAADGMERARSGRERIVDDNLYLKGMVIIRLLSATLEFTGAFLMWRFQRLDTAVRINGFLGLVGPLILTSTMLLGVAGLALGKMPVGKIFWIGTGVLCILWGTSR